MSNANAQPVQCDEVKPVCGLCQRRGLECVGNGVKRTGFRFYGGDGKAQRRTLTTAPKRSPSNDATTLSAAVVHILEVDDIRYDLRAYGHKFITTLPALVGSSPELDTMTAAIVSLYRRPQPKVEAFTQYGKALRTARKVLQDAESSPVDRMQIILMLFICQVQSPTALSTSSSPLFSGD